MKCVCGYFCDSEKNKDVLYKDRSTSNNTTPFLEFNVCIGHSTDFTGLTVDETETFYACPVCGTLKIKTKDWKWHGE